MIGSGVSGLTAAYLLSRSHEVTLFEKEPRFGGHAHTHDVSDEAPNAGRDAWREGSGSSATPVYQVDSGFIVHNDRTYPYLRRLFGELGVAIRPTEMSMSITCRDCGLEYAGGRGVGGVLAKPSRIADRRYAQLLWQVRRFHREALVFLRDTDDTDQTSYGDWLDAHAFTDYFVSHYAIPLVACVWSTGQATALEYPARYLMRFLHHHGMLSIGDSPQWYTVVGGSRSYVERLVARLADARAATPVTGLEHRADGIVVATNAGTHHYDAAVVATHADEALALWSNPTPDERRVLGALPTSANATVLHTDPSLLPAARRARASWNYLMDSCSAGESAPVVTYWMNRLQGHDSTRPHLVTLNARERIDPGSIIASMTYTHPVYTLESVRAQGELASLNTDRVAYAGAYHGWGFHEDGCRSGVAAAAHFGVGW